MTRQPDVQAGKAVTLPVVTKLGYACGGFSNALLGSCIGMYLLLYLTDIVALNPALVGVAFSIGRFWDAVTDPTMGHVSDRTRSRYGRRRPYIVFGAPFLAAAFVILWYTPLRQPAAITFAYVLLGNLCLTTAQTVVGVPYGALGAELTLDYRERNSVMAYAQGAVMLGSLAGTGLIGLASVAGAWRDPALGLAGARGVLDAFLSSESYAAVDGVGFRIAAVVLAPAMVLALWATALTTRENPGFQRRSDVPALRSLAATLRNRPFRLIVAAFLASTVLSQIGGFMLPYIIIHWLGRPGYVMPIFLTYTGGMIAGLPLWRAAGQRFEKKHCYIASVGLGSLVAPAFLLVVTPEWPQSMLLWAIAFGLCGGGTLIFPPSMIADVVDADELESELRREGAFLGIHSFVQKCAASLGALWVGPGLALAGYDGTAAVQPEQTLLIMRLMFILPIPVAGVFVMLALARFPLDSRTMAGVRAAIDARRAAGETATG